MFDKAKRKRDMDEMKALVQTWPDADAALLEAHLEKSLDAVTHLTEYQDEKASRLMTAMAFVGALVAAVHALALQFVFTQPGMVANGFNFCFWLFYGLAVVGSLLVIYGIMPRFNMPKKDNGPRPLSLVFAPEIERVSGTVWANEFIGKTALQLDAQSAKCQLTEVKLIAHKAVLKTRTLRQASGCYIGSLWSLVAGILVLGLGIVNKSFPPAHAVVVFDADNTLWDTNALYAQAQATLVSGVEKLASNKAPEDKVAYLRRFDEEIAQSHPRGFRYPIRLLIAKLYQDLSGRVATPELEPEFVALEKVHEQTIAGAPRLFPGAKEALSTLSSKGYRLILLSEGNPDHVIERLGKNEIRDYFFEVQVKRKTTEVFQQIRNANALGEKTVFISVGDRLDVDLDLARQAGYHTVHIPGGFRPFAANVECLKPDRSIVSLNELPPLVESFR